MIRMPFHVFGADVYSNQSFVNLNDLLARYEEPILKAHEAMGKRSMVVGAYLVFKHQVVALPPPEFDQRLLVVADMPGSTIDSKTYRVGSVPQGEEQ